MADIKKYLDDIMKAVYGEQVRGSIHDAIDAINTFTEEGKVEQDEAITEGLKDILIDLKTEVKKMEDNLIKAGIRQFAVVDTLPSASEASDGVIYFYFNQDTEHYDMYAKIKGTLELIDDTTIDTTGFVTKEEIVPLKTKLDGIEDNAQVNKIESISVNGTPVDPDEAKNVDIKAYNEDNKPEVGGRNLIIQSKLENGYLNDNGTINQSSSSQSRGDITSDYIEISSYDTEFVCQLWVTVPSAGDVYNTYIGWYFFTEKTAESHIGKSRTLSLGSATDEGFCHRTVAISDIPKEAKYIRLTARFFDDGKMKLERGEIPTDWGPAPEDLMPAQATIFDLCPDGIMHRNLFRGKNLGDHVTAEQLAAIKDGSFKDLFIGDYWVIGNVNWLIADMDYFYQAGNTAFTKHHLVIIPQGNLYNAQMNSTNITEGGYVGSEMYKTGLENAKTKIKAAFGDMVQTHRDILINATTEGHPSGYIWTDSKVELMTEVMVYGTYHYAVMNPGSYLPTKYTTARQQFAIFALNPYYAFIGRIWYWLRDVVSATGFAGCHGDGGADYDGASASIGVRPYFCIGSNDPDADMPVEGPEMMDEYIQHEMEE